VNALAPAPAALTTFRGQPVKLLAAEPAGETTDAPAGMLLAAGGALRVATGGGVLVIHHLQPAGKRPMTGEAFLRGAHPDVSERFG